MAVGALRACAVPTCSRQWAPQYMQDMRLQCKGDRHKMVSQKGGHDMVMTDRLVAHIHPGAIF